MSINELPSFVQQNLAMVQENMRTILNESAQLTGKVDSEGIYNSTFNDIVTSFDDSEFSSGLSQPSFVKNQSKAGVSGNIAESKAQDFIKTQNKLTTEKDASIKKAYDSLLNGEAANEYSKVLSKEEDTKTSLMEKINKLKNHALDKNTSLVTDNEFFDSKALSANEIDKILAKKGSPYVNQKFDGMSIGQLIYKECKSAGTVPQGSHTINPALIVSIMGAESGFGSDPKSVKNNPFNIRVNGGFTGIPDVKTSLNMAVNTMYNWAMSRPKDSKVSFFDFAGDKYCENYKLNWKPNVEKHFLEFTINDSILASLNTPSANTQKKPDVTALLSSMGGLGSQTNKGLMDINSLMQAVNNKDADPMSKMNLLSSMTPNSMLAENKEE